MWGRHLLGCAVLALCVGCSGGPVLESYKEGDFVEADLKQVDGGFIRYFLPRGELTAKAVYNEKNQQLALAVEQIKSMPDYDEHHYLVYTHAALATDEIDIQTEGGLLKSVSSTAADQSLPAINEISGVIQQIKATAAALKEVDIQGVAPSTKPEKLAEKCQQGLTYTKVIDVTNRKLVRDLNENFDSPCQISLKIYTSEKDAGLPTKKEIENLFPVHKLHSRVSSEEGELTDGASCSENVCFRLAGAFTARVEACLVDKEGTPIRGPQVVDGKKVHDRICATSTYQFLAPAESPLGFIRFNRRAFVQNSLTATFSNGMLTGIKAKDPSELVGFLAVPTALLKQAAIVATF